MTSPGSTYSRFQRALTTGNLQLIEAAAAELPRVSLEDALAILIVPAPRGDPRFERAAARWVGRLLTETPARLSDARFALALVERLRNVATRCVGSPGAGEANAAGAPDSAASDR
jgi:hypothetical protein